MLLTFSSLQKRLLVLLVVPVALFLAGAGVSGYYYMWNALVKEWQKIAMLKMERAAHQMDMRLEQPRRWMEDFAKADSDITRRWILKQLRHLPGVSRVEVTLGKPGPGRRETGPVARPFINRFTFSDRPGFWPRRPRTFAAWPLPPCSVSRR